MSKYTYDWKGLRFRLLVLRKHHLGLTQKEMSEKCCGNITEYGKYERGTVETASLPAVMAIADYAGCSLEWLLRGKGDWR